MLKNYVVVDLEMTGLSPAKDKILEIGAVKVIDGKVAETFQTLINPNVEIREKITKITGINEKMTKDCPNIDTVLQEFLHFLGDYPLVGHNIIFDFSFIMQAVWDFKVESNEVENDFIEKSRNRRWFGIDTLFMARKYLGEEESKRLEDLCERFEIRDVGHHRALNDAYVTKELYEKLCVLYETGEENITQPTLLVYKPKKNRKPHPSQIKYAEELIKYYDMDVEQDIYSMNQSDLSRFIDKTISKYGKIHFCWKDFK